jgi:hypothetical protein
MAARQFLYTRITLLDRMTLAQLAEIGHAKTNSEWNSSAMSSFADGSVGNARRLVAALCRSSFRTTESIRQRTDNPPSWSFLGTLTSLQASRKNCPNSV